MGNCRKILVDSPRGPRVCLILLDRLASFFEADSSSEEGRAFDIGYVCQTGSPLCSILTPSFMPTSRCEIFSRITEANLIPKLYDKLALCVTSSQKQSLYLFSCSHPLHRKDEPITPHQTTLLKIIDSFLHHSNSSHKLSLRQPEKGGHCLLDMLAREFLALSTYMQTSIHRGFGSPGEVLFDCNSPRQLGIH